MHGLIWDSLAVMSELFAVALCSLANDREAINHNIMALEEKIKGIKDPQQLHGAAVAAGSQSNWQKFGEYLDSLSCKETKIDEMQYNLDAVCLAQQIKKKKNR